MRIPIVAISIVAVLTASAYTRPKTVTDPAKIAEIERNLGGRVTPPSNGKSVLIWDTTGKAQSAIEAFRRYDDKILHLPISIKSGAAPRDLTCYQAAKSARSTQMPCVIYIFHTEGVPSLTIYPEEAIACVNVAAIRAPSDHLTEERLRKEIFRAFALALGGYTMPQMPCVLEPVYSPEALDAVRSKTLAPVRFNGIIKSANLLDIPILRSAPYAIAVRQGWAPAPTNDIQKAIWDKAHAEKERGPSNPIQIKP